MAARSTYDVVRENLSLLMKAHPELDSNPKLSEKTGLGTGTLSRLRNGKANATLETLEALAKGFGYEPWQLLVPGFDPKSPPTLQPLSDVERKLYKRFREVAKEIIKQEH